jgi:hypothetical protein
VLYIHKNQRSEVKQIVEQSISNYKRESSAITFGYLGSINNIIDTDGISELIRSLIKNGITVNVKIVGGGEGDQRFIESIESAGAHAKNYGFVFDSIKNAQIFSTCDLGLNMMVGNIAVGLTTKSVDYFSFALPVVNNIKGDTTELVESRKIGINYSGNAEQILNLSDDDIIRMKKNAYQCYLDLMTPQGLFDVAQSALRHIGIL